MTLPTWLCRPSFLDKNHNIIGMGIPSLEFLQISAEKNQLKLVVTLTEDPLPITYTENKELKNLGVTFLHLPIPDGKAPTHEQQMSMVQSMDKIISRDPVNPMGPQKQKEKEEEQNNPMVAIHCLAGRGRTGTMLATWLVWKNGPVGKRLDM